MVSLTGTYGFLVALRNRFTRTLWIVFLCAGAMIATVSTPRPASACAVCVTLPEASLADHLISAEIIVLAGPSPENPFRFAPKALIKGTTQDLERIPEIPFLIDSATRATFRNHPNKSILFTYGSIDKDAAGRTTSRSWKRIFTLTPEREQFLSDLRDAAAFWTPGSRDNTDRVEFFIKFITSDDLILRDAALIEMDRASHPIVKSLRPRVPTDQLMEEFRNITRIRFVPVSIRLLALQTDDPDAVAIVRSRYPNALRSGRGYLYEWGLAGIEVDGPVAVKSVENALGSKGMKLGDRRALVRALADGGTSSPMLRDQIVDIFSKLLDDDAALALIIAKALHDWSETRLDYQLRALMENEATDPVTRFAIQIRLMPND